MGRISADKAAASPRPVGRQAIWDAIRCCGADGFTRAELADMTDIPRRTVGSYLDCLLAARIIAPVTCLRFRLVDDRGREAPRVDPQGRPVTQGLSREQMWRTMKMVGDFTARDLAVAASTEQVAVNEVDADDYCKNLAKAGYLAIVRPGKPGRPALYRFVRAKNTGPKPPMVQRMQTVFDPNLGKIVWHPDVES